MDSEKIKILYTQIKLCIDVFEKKNWHDKMYIFTSNLRKRALCIVLLLLKSTRPYRLKIIKSFPGLHHRRLHNCV